MLNFVRVAPANSTAAYAGYDPRSKSSNRRPVVPSGFAKSLGLQRAYWDDARLKNADLSSAGTRSSRTRVKRKWLTMRSKSKGRTGSSRGRSSRNSKRRAYWSKMPKCSRPGVRMELPWRRCLYSTHTAGRQAMRSAVSMVL
ncbi:hypothetical protein SALBM135S_00995 [Streptomyces alboniger]